MKKIITLLTAFVLIVVATQYDAQSMPGTSTPFLSPNPAHDYIKVNWQQTQCNNVLISIYYMNGSLARTLTNRQYCDGNYAEIFKVAGMIRGNYIVRVQIGLQAWSYKLIIQ